jgi:hypothetical protein
LNARISAYLSVTLALLTGCGRSFDNPSDPDAGRYTTKSEAFLKRLGETDPVEGDTVRFVGGVTSAPVEADGLVAEYAWDLDGDGTVDTIATGTDTLSMAAGAPGARKLRLILTDKAGRTDAAGLEYQVHPGLARLFRLKGYPSDCPAYAHEPALMRMALALSHFAVERNREDGFASADFALKLAQALTGEAFPLSVLNGFDYSFSHGLYHFRNDDLTLDVAFHYGPGMPGHAEGDTIRSNLFDLESYVTDYDYTLLPPSFDYSQGPLADLVTGDIDVDAADLRHPRFDFRVDFNRIRMSFSRSTHTLLVLSNQEITLANALFFTLYEGKARMAPLYPPDLVRLYGRDSLELDFAGTRVSSPVLPLAWAYEENGVKDTAVYHLSLSQETLRQSYRFGDAGGVRKVFGEYAAVNRLGVGGGLEAVYFKGGYSTTAPDSVRFYCREPMESPDLFGAAAFETAEAGRGSFASERYGYGFTFPFSTVEPWKGATQDLPPALRE